MKQIKTEHLRRNLAFILILSVSLLTSACAHIKQTAHHHKIKDWPHYEDKQAQAFNTYCLLNLKQAESIYDMLMSRQIKVDSLIDNMNEIDRLANITLGRSTLYANVHPLQPFREAAEHCDLRFTALQSKIALSQPIFEQLKKVQPHTLDAEDKHYLKSLLRDYNRNGVQLSSKNREHIESLKNEINELGKVFYQHTRDDIRKLAVKPSAVKGLPTDFIQSHYDSATGLVNLTTDYTDYLPVMQYAEDDNLRLKLYKAFRSRGYPQNKSVLRELLRKRYELAKLVGYANFAAYNSEIQMIQSEKAAQNFIDKITAIATPLAEKEYAALLAELKTIDPQATTVGDWQKTYLQQRIKKKKYNVNAQEVRKYFPYSHVKTGIFSLAEKLFDIEIRHWQTDTWHESVEAFEIVDHGVIIGRFYLDMHPREGKYKHAAAFTLQDGMSGKQLPIYALVCNFPPGKGLMEHEQVETFLHEFGHLLHGIFGGSLKRIRYAGTSTERDFVEAPSQMLEEWAWNPDTLKLLSQNSEHEKIPTDLIEKLNASRGFGLGLFTTQQMFYAAVSLNYYSRPPDSFDDMDLLIQLQEKYSHFSYVEGTSMQYAFGHLVGYSSSYYGYMWSLVIAEDMFSKFLDAGLMNQRIAKQYREKILAPGGSKNAQQLVREFLGRPYSFNAFSNKFH